MKPINGLSAFLGATALVFATAACDNTANGMKQDAQENKREAAEASAEARQKADNAADRAERSADRAADKTADAADRAGNSMANAADKTADAAKEVGQKTGDAMKDLGRSADAAVQTMDVKSALIADKRVDASGIDVDTNATTKTVTLKGHVPTAAQKTVAADIARSKAEGYSIKNELRVSAGN